MSRILKLKNVFNLRNFLFYLGCNTTTEGLSPLGAKTRCSISPSCTDVHCCLQSDTLQEMFDAYIYLDSCNSKVTVGIEKFQWNDTLVDYQFGTSLHVSLFGLVNLE